MITELAGLKVNGKIKAPMPFSGEATILGFRYYTSRNTGRTYMVGDYLTDDGKMAFDSVEKLVKHAGIGPWRDQLSDARKCLEEALHTSVPMTPYAESRIRRALMQIEKAMK